MFCTYDSVVVWSASVFLCWPIGSGVISVLYSSQPAGGAKVQSDMMYPSQPAGGARRQSDTLYPSQPVSGAKVQSDMIDPSQPAGGARVQSNMIYPSKLAGARETSETLQRALPITAVRGRQCPVRHIVSAEIR